jgi:hypothetical protein
MIGQSGHGSEAAKVALMRQDEAWSTSSSGRAQVLSNSSEGSFQLLGPDCTVVLRTFVTQCRGLYLTLYCVHAL